VIRPAEHLVHRGPVAVIDGRTCALLNRVLRLDKVRAEIRGQDAELDQALVAIRLAGIAYDQSSAAGTTSAPNAEPERRLKPQLHDTVSTTTAATILGITDRAVRKAITEKRLPATHLDGRWRIHRQDLTNYLGERP